MTMCKSFLITYLVSVTLCQASHFHSSEWDVWSDEKRGCGACCCCFASSTQVFRLSLEDTSNAIEESFFTQEDRSYVSKGSSWESSSRSYTASNEVADQLNSLASPDKKALVSSWLETLSTSDTQVPEVVKKPSIIQTANPRSTRKKNRCLKYAVQWVKSTVVDGLGVILEESGE